MVLLSATRAVGRFLLQVRTGRAPTSGGAAFGKNNALPKCQRQPPPPPPPPPTGSGSTAILGTRRKQQHQWSRTAAATPLLASSSRRAAPPSASVALLARRRRTASGSLSPWHHPLLWNSTNSNSRTSPAACFYKNDNKSSPAVGGGAHSQHRCCPFSTEAAAAAAPATTSDLLVPNNTNKIQILYASQTGTAQMFAMQLADALDLGGDDGYAPLSDYCGAGGTANSNPCLQPDGTWYILIVATAGVGEPPDNGRAFFEALDSDSNIHNNRMDGVAYSVFALGNSAAHAGHYCAFGADLDRRLQAAGACAVLPLCCGDDAGCIEDDFDHYQQTVLEVLSEKKKNKESANENANATAPNENAETSATENVVVETANVQEDPVDAVAPASTVPAAPRRRTGHFPRLELVPPPDPELRRAAADLVDHPALASSSFYAAGSARFPVLQNRVLRCDVPSAATNPSALRELRLQIPAPPLGGDDKNGNHHPQQQQQCEHYETGDHLIVYPRNSDVLVEAYLAVIEDAPHPHTTIAGVADPNKNSSEASTKKKKSPTYPHPLGITLYETLRHCVDLQAPPSPALARYLTDKPELPNYRTEIAQPRRTVLELLHAHRHYHLDAPQIPLQDLLFQLPPLQPRYYSIASSNLAHPDTIYLTYRPVKYYSATGNLREGVCTSFLSSVVVANNDDSDRQKNNNSNQQPPPSIVAAIRSNPQFRLPAAVDATTAATATPPPIVLVAGGCGVAPIRAFLEELVWHAQNDDDSDSNSAKAAAARYGRVHLYLGFRNPEDEVYRDLVEAARRLDLLAEPVHISYTSGSRSNCGLVSDSIVRSGKTLLDLLTGSADGGGGDDESDKAVLYVCGGARLFGVAIQNAIQDVLQQQGGMDEAAATAFLQAMRREGRYHEDLSD